MRGWDLRPGVKAELNPVRWGLNAFVAEIDLSLATMMSDVDVHGEQDFSPGKIPVG
jgi:hypothetical protein